MQYCKTCQASTWDSGGFSENMCDDCWTKRQEKKGLRFVGTVAEFRAWSRLEYLREQIEKEAISYGEIIELQSLAKYIEAGDVVLLEWAGVNGTQEADYTRIK